MGGFENSIYCKVCLYTMYIYISFNLSGCVALIEVLWLLSLNLYMYVPTSWAALVAQLVRVSPKCKCREFKSHPETANFSLKDDCFG